MNANWRQNGNWPTRLKDWERRGAGPVPGERLWDRIEADLATPRKKRIFPGWWFLALGVILVATLLGPSGDDGQSLTEIENLQGKPRAVTKSMASINPAPQTAGLPRGDAERRNIMAGVENPTGNAGVASILSPATGLNNPAPVAANERGLLPKEHHTPPGPASSDDPRGIPTSLPGATPSDGELARSPGPGSLRADASRDSGEFAGAKTALSPDAVGVETLTDVVRGNDEGQTMERWTSARAVQSPAFLPPTPTAYVHGRTPRFSRRVSPPGKFRSVVGSAPFSVEFSGGITRMRTEVKTPMGVELSPVNRGERFETGMGSFLALKVQKGHFGFAAGYREQPQRNAYFNRLQLSFDRNQERDSPDGLRTSTYELESKDGFSESTLEIEVKRSRNTVVAEGAILRVEVRTDQELDVRTLPLLFTYERPIGRLFSLRVGAGFSHNELRLSQSRTITRVQLGNGLILNRNRLLRGQSTTQRFNYWALQTQAGLYLAPRNFPLSLGLGFDLSRSLGDWRPQRPDRRWLETSGVNVTAAVRF